MPHGPTPVVEISFDDGPYVASPTWVDVTSYVRDITIHRGRSSDFDQFDTGTAQLVLDNRTRLFDPFYTSGTYYGKLLPRRQIRIRGTANSTTYDVFRGYIAGWPVTWSEAGYDSTVTIQAFDALGLMANETLPTDWADYITRSYSPAVYFKGNDSQGTNVILDAISGTKTLANENSATYPYFFEADQLAEGAASKSVWTSSYIGTNLAASINTARTPDYPDITVSAWVKGIGGWSNPSLGIHNNGGQTFFIIKSDKIEFQYFKGGLGTQYFRSFASASLPPFGQPFHIFYTISGTSTPSVYLNGEAITLTSATTQSGTGTAYYELAIVTQNINFQELAVWQNTDFTAAQVKEIYQATAARISETTTARMNRLIATTSYPAALQNFTASPVATVSEIGSGAGVIAEMQLVADSEGGEIYVTKDGKLTTTARFDVFNATRSANVQATITDSGAGLKYGPDLLIEYDADNLKNDISVQFSGDGEVTASSDYTIATYGGASTTIETQLDSPTSATELANMELGIEGVLIPRISPLDLTPNTAAADWATILGLELLDRVTFKRTPTTGNQFSRDALINAIDHQITPGLWQTQVTLSMRYTSPETLDDDVLGLLDLNYLG